MIKFIDIIRSMHYLREDKDEVKWFISCFPQSYRDNIEFHDLNIMDEVLRYAK